MYLYKNSYTKISDNKTMKMKSILFIYLFICAGCVGLAAAAVNATRCCDPGFYMKQNKTIDAIYCRNNVTNVTQPSVLDCQNSSMITEEQANFNVSADGEVLFWNEWGPEVMVGYCVGEVNAKLKAANKFVVRSAVASCRVVPLVDPHAKAWCFLVSVVFLYATALIYAALPELRDLEGKSIVNLCVSLGTAFLILAIQHITHPPLDSTHCLLKAFFCYFFVIAAFFWMNAISLQVLWSIRRPTIPDYSWRKFTWYAVYAWGLALALTVLVAVLEAVDGPHAKPGIGRNSCWFYSRKEKWMYMYSVILVILLGNLSIFAYMSVNIFRSTFKSDHTIALRYKYCMMFRLCIIMGIPWFFEMITGSIEEQIITIIFDFIIALVGLLFFVVLVVLRLRTIKALHGRKLLCCLTGIVGKIIAEKDDLEARAVAHTAVMSLDDNQLN